MLAPVVLPLALAASSALALAGGPPAVRPPVPAAAGAGADGASSAVVVDEAVGTDPTTLTSTASPPPENEGDGNWLDIGHAFIEHRLFAPVLRVDRFFSDERDLEPERARSFIQWRQELRFQQRRQTPTYTTTIGANLKLPGLNKELRKLQVEITGQTRDAFTALFPGDRASPGEVPTRDTAFGTADAGLGYRLFETVASKVASHGDLGAGVIFRLPPGVYGRARLRFSESLGNRFLARQATAVFWRTDTRFGTTGTAEIERPLGASTLARLSGSGTLTERSRGIEWGGDLSFLGTLKARIGAQVGFGVSGAARAPVDVDVYRFYVRFRRDFYRKWIFLELNPEYGWPWEPDVGRRGSWAVVLRVELQFQGTEAPKAPAPDEPEPPDPQEPRPPTGDLGTPSALPDAPAPG